ncbi:MAG: nucleoside recognition domain-containing protein [Eubacteriales bacterium]
MTMSYLWTILLVISVFFAFITGNIEEVSFASIQGGQSAVELCFSMTGAICFWSGMMEVMRQCGLIEKLAKLLRPLLKWLFPDVAENQKTMGDISANISANFLGLGNAATPLGLQAAKGLATYSKGGRATDSLCLFIVCNTASIQLIPSTVASLRAACGSENPFEILPAVWITSLGSVAVGILLCRFFSRWGVERG